MRAKRRPALLWGLSSGVVLILVLAAALVASTTAKTAETPQRVSFQISTGSTSGSFFPVGELLAGLLSHPPGISRCEGTDLCGPAGLIVNARTTEGSVANVLAVNAGTTNSGLAQVDVVAQAVAGDGPFHRAGATKHIRVIANLYKEDLYLVAARKAKIINVGDLRNKRVGLSTEGSGTTVMARAVLAAYHLPEWRIIPNHDPVERAAELMRAGKLDAFFFVGGTPVDLIRKLLDDNVAVLIPIDGVGRKRLLAKEPYLSAHVIAQGVYPGTPAVDTVSVDALWITNAAQPDDLIYDMVKALYNSKNRPMIEARAAGRDFFKLADAAKNAIAPLHPGAAKFYTEAHLLPATEASAQ